MSGREYLADTNILIYLFDGNTSIAELLEGQLIFVSFISEMELLSKQGLTNAQSVIIKKALKDFYHFEFNDEIKESAIEFRKKYNLKLPDAIVAATSKYLNIPLITSDKSFKKIDEISIILVSP